MNTTPALTKSDYLFSTANVGTSNKFSAFNDEGEGVFFIQPGAKNPSGGMFIFNKRGMLVLNFSIRKNSHVGDIEFTVGKNEKVIKKIRV